MKKLSVQVILILTIGVLSVLVVLLLGSIEVLFGHRSVYQEKSQTYDFGSDSTQEKVVMAEGKLDIKSEGEVLFSSEDNQEVTDFVIGDINNDGQDELCYGFWRKGDYGKNLPFSKARRDPLKSYHLYLYEYLEEQNVFHLLWGSSTLPEPIYDMEILNDDGKNTLKVIEGDYEDYDSHGYIEPKKTTKWAWNEWWFEEIE